VTTLITILTVTPIFQANAMENISKSTAVKDIILKKNALSKIKN